MSHRGTIEGLFKAIDARDYDAVARTMTDDCEFRAPGGADLSGGEQAVAWMKPFLEAFPDLTHELVGFVEDGDIAAFELAIKGTHTAPLASPQGNIPPTGKPVVLYSCDIARMQGDQIASYHIYFDMMGFMAQLGLVG
jgi:steroid delta-isomerase-like uncharacterized protein